MFLILKSLLKILLISFLFFSLKLSSRPSFIKFSSKGELASKTAPTLSYSLFPSGEQDLVFWGEDIKIPDTCSEIVVQKNEKNEGKKRYSKISFDLSESNEAVSQMVENSTLLLSIDAVELWQDDVNSEGPILYFDIIIIPELSSQNKSSKYSKKEDLTDNDFEREFNKDNEEESSISDDGEDEEGEGVEGNSQNTDGI